MSLPLTELDLEQMDIEWYGIDDCGIIAAFVTGGHGVLPEVYQESPDKLSIVRKAIHALPTQDGSEIVLSSSLRKHIGYPKDRPLPDLKVDADLARRGVYVYDFSREQKISTS